MQIIEITALSNGAHRNQTLHGELPEGWAIIPEGMVCENFPFGEVEAELVDGVMTLTKWTPGLLPEPAPTPEPGPTLETRVTDLETTTAQQEELLNILLSGDTGEETE